METNSVVVCPPGFTVTEENLTAEQFRKKLNVLKQMRKVFVGIDGLAVDIESRGLMHPVICVQLNAKLAKEYVELVSTAYGGERSIKKIVCTSPGVYRFVVAGERRTRAIRSIKNAGLYPIRIYHPGPDADLREMLYRQVAENVSKQVMPFEDGEAIAALWNLSNEETRKYTAIGKLIGRTAEVVSAAVTLHGAPQFVRDWVNADPEERYLWGTVVAKLPRAEVDARVIQRVMDETLVRRPPKQQLERQVSAIISHHKEIQSGDGSLGLFARLDPVDELTEAFRNRLGEDTVRDAYVIAHELRVLYELCRTVLPKDAAAVLQKRRTSDALQEVFRLAGLVLDLLPEGEVPQIDTARMKRVLKQASAI